MEFALIQVGLVALLFHNHIANNPPIAIKIAKMAPKNNRMVLEGDESIGSKSYFLTNF
jgi:hypothetical protein